MKNIQQRVSIKNARFHAPIGYYQEERLLGNEFFVDVEVLYPHVRYSEDNLVNTLNYEMLYQVIQAAMQAERKLLESAAEEILEKLLTQFSFIVQLDVCIRKMNPPFGGDVSTAEICLHFKV